MFPLAREDCDLSVPCSVSSVLTCTCILEHLILKPLYPTNLVVCVFSWSWVGNINWWYYVSSQLWVNQGRTIIILRGWRLGNFHRHKIFSHLKAKNNFLSGRQYKNLFNMNQSIMFCHVFPGMIGCCPRIYFLKYPKILVRPYHLHAISEILTAHAEISPCEAFYSVVLTSASMSISKEASFTSTEIRANQVLTKSIDVTYGTWSIALINICQGNANKL